MHSRGSDWEERPLQGWVASRRLLDPLSDSGMLHDELLCPDSQLLGFIECYTARSLTGAVLVAAATFLALLALADTFRGAEEAVGAAIRMLDTFLFLLAAVRALSLL